MRRLSISRYFAAIASLIASVGAGTAETGCQQGEDNDVLPPAGLSLAPPTPVVTSPLGPTRFGKGWFPIESNAQGSWRWMGAVGEIQVPTFGAKARLKILGWAPVELLAKPPTLRIVINGHEIDHFVAPVGRLKKEYNIALDQQGDLPEALLQIETSATAMAPGDPRELGFALVSVAWTAAP